MLMPTYLYVDGDRYLKWTPSDEEKEFHPLVKQNYKQIFGEVITLFTNELYAQKIPKR
jgi:hypothetical protein